MEQTNTTTTKLNQLFDDFSSASNTSESFEQILNAYRSNPNEPEVIKIMSNRLKELGGK